MKLLNIEKETILNFNEGEEFAALYTYNPKLRDSAEQPTEDAAAPKPQEVA